MSFNRTNRKIHKWGSIIIAIPLLVVIATGILLLLKKELSFIQPPTATGSGQIPQVTFAQVLSIATTVEQAQISDWSDIDRLDVRPDKGIIKIRSNNKIEIQIDSENGAILHVAERNSDLIESIHDGTFFEKRANLWLMLPVAIVALALLITGVILFFVPYLKKRNRPGK